MVVLVLPARRIINGVELHLTDGGGVADGRLHTQLLETLSLQLVVFDQLVGSHVVVWLSILDVLIQLFGRHFDPLVKLYIYKVGQKGSIH